MVDTIDPAAHGEASAAPGWQPAAAPLMSAKAPDGQPLDEEEELTAEAWHRLAHRFLEASSFLQQRPLTGTKVVLFPEVSSPCHCFHRDPLHPCSVCDHLAS